MGIYSGAEIPNSGLVFNLDAANPKNFGLTAVQVLVVAGGGGGGGGVIYNPNFSVTPGTAYTVTVGGGGARGQIYNEGAQGYGYNGGNSVFGSLTAIGGGGGGNYNSNTAQVGGSGGGGGGAGSAAAAGTSGQGNSGGSGSSAAYGSGGGGGAGSAGQSVTGIVGGSGGNGLAFDISGTATFYGGGGGGGGGNDSSSDGRGYGGLGGGGTGAARTGTFASLADNVKNGAPNTGGGGGGTGGWNSAGAGGSGIVIVRYPGPQRAIGGTVTRVGNDTVHTFTSVGSTTFTPLISSTFTGLTDFGTGSNFGTATNGPTYNTSNNGSVVFDGTDDYISIPNSSAINPNTGSFTIVIWANSDPSNGGDGWDLWVSKRSNGSNGYYIGANNPSGVRFMLGNDANSRTDTGFISYTYNTWAMFTGILDRATNTQTIIRNNYEETASVTPSGGNYYNTAVLSIGGDFANGSQFYVNGRIGIVQMYNRALSAAEVAQLFESSRGRYGI